MPSSASPFPDPALPYGKQLQLDLVAAVTRALAEDVGSGDITARLIPEQAIGKARIITREAAVLCGTAWVEEVFRQVDSRVQVHWLANDGHAVQAGQALCELEGPLRGLLTAERTALNFLQTLSGTATTCRHYADLVRHTRVALIDTRKTIPGLRTAQKYAVTVGGCRNHRIGLYDAFLVKENHIAACGSIGAAVARAREQAPGKPVEVEVENRAELQQALAANADIIMLDNFALADIKEAAGFVAGRCKLEISGGITDSTLVPLAETGVDFISIGGLTKHLHAIDLSMRVL